MSSEDLKLEIFKAQQEGDIALLYKLEQDAHELFDEEMLHDYYSNILDLALERLTDALESHRVMNMDEVQDFATLRALYEYAIEHYSAGKLSDAAALFEVLGGLSNNKEFSHALKFHWISSTDDIPFEEFLSGVADIEATQNAGTFYISHFRSEAQELLVESEMMAKEDI